ncbi:MAG: hypothetical protein WCO71_03105 [Pseudomonadota bacterium]
MNRFLIGLSYLLFLNFELALFMMGGVYGGRYLNSHHALGFDWVMVTTPVSVLLCCIAIYRYLVVIVKSEREKAKHD